MWHDKGHPRTLSCFLMGEPSCPWLESDVLAYTLLALQKYYSVAVHPQSCAV